MKCPNLEALFIQHIQVGILRGAFEDEGNKIAAPTLYNDFLQKFFCALRNAKKLGVLRYFFHLISTVLIDSYSAKAFLTFLSAD